jgi:hypothetical protein
MCPAMYRRIRRMTCPFGDGAPLRLLSMGIDALVVAFALAGCSTSGSTQVNKPLASSVANARSVMVRVTSQVPHSQETTRELEGAIVEKLRDRGAFERASTSLATDARAVDVIVDTTIIKFHGVHEGARIGGLLGMAAGRTAIVADVVLKNGKNDEVLGAATVESSGSSSGLTMEAIQEAAEQVVRFMTSR